MTIFKIPGRILESTWSTRVYRMSGVVNETQNPSWVSNFNDVSNITKVSHQNISI